MLGKRSPKLSGNWPMNKAMNKAPNTQPKIGLAFSGASARSVFYIGFLEVLQERKVPIDYIAACSSGAIVAAAYACGKLPKLRDEALKMNKELMFSLLDRSKTRG